MASPTLSSYLINALLPSQHTSTTYSPWSSDKTCTIKRNRSFRSTLHCLIGSGYTSLLAALIFVCNYGRPNAKSQQTINKTYSHGHERGFERTEVIFVSTRRGSWIEWNCDPGLMARHTSVRKLLMFRQIWVKSALKSLWSLSTTDQPKLPCNLMQNWCNSFCNNCEMSSIRI